MFIITCAACNQPLNLPDEAAGKTIRCLRCMSIIMVTEHPDQIAGYPSGAETTEVDEEAHPKDANEQAERSR